MTVSASISSILSSATTTPQVVTAGVGADGTSVDAATSKVTGSGSSTSATTKSSTSDVTKNEFLMLLVTQLKYQDPLSPMDNSQFLSQLAQFQALEANTNMQKGIEALGTEFKDTVAAQQNSAQSMNNASAVSLIGKQARIKESDVIWDATAGATIPITVNLGNKSGADVQILDSDGNVVKTLQTATKDAQNSSTVTWDGSTDKGDYAAAGTYKVNIVGQDKDDSLYAFIQNIVTGVRFTKDGVLLKIGGRELAASDVMDVAMDASGSAGFDNGSTAGAIGLLGKTVRARQDSVTYNGKDGEHDIFKVNASPYNSVQVGITDASGNLIAAFQQAADSTGLATIDWNGQKYDGSFVKKGNYNIVINGEENNPSLYAYTEGVVDGISNLGGMVQLKVGGQNVLLSNVVNIQSGTTASSSGNSI
jgi:flagellar basal-body rod modification protein FlgD